MGKRGMRCDVCELDDSLGEAAGTIRERSGHGRCGDCSFYAAMCCDLLRTDAEDQRLQTIAARLVAAGKELPWPIEERANRS